MKAIKIVIIVGLLYGLYSIFVVKSTINEMDGIVAKIPSLMNDISIRWDVSDLKKHLSPIFYDNHLDSYKTMFEKASFLGAFKICENMRFGTPNNFKVEEARAIVGNSRFVNGNAKVTILYLEYEDEKEIMGLIVNVDA